MMKYNARKIHEEHTINNTNKHQTNYYVFEHIEGRLMTFIEPTEIFACCDIYMPIHSSFFIWQFPRSSIEDVENQIQSNVIVKM